MRIPSLRSLLASCVFAVAAAFVSATPTLTLQPPDQVTTVGGSASFTLAATVPSGTLSYKWQVSTDNGTTFTDITNVAPYSNATTATLTITGATFALQGYRYRGVATQTGGTGPGAINSNTVTLFQDLAWDPGSTDTGTQVFTAGATTVASRYFFRITPQATTVGAWRTALRVTSGTADVYLKQNTLPTSLTDAAYKSERAGTVGDGFVLPSSAFAAAQTWYVMVNASANAQWSLVSGEAYVQNLGTLAADATSSSGNITMGAEGYRFFKTSTPASAAAWRVWLNDGALTPATLTTSKIAVRRTAVPFVDGTYDHQQSGHMLLVPPYLNTGGDTYFLAVTGTPGTAINLDSRSLTPTDLPFGSSTSFTLPAAGYALYRSLVPLDQIGWEAALSGLSANVDIAIRRDNAASEWFNDAFSEIAGTVGDSVTLVPPILTNGTYYITLYNSGSAATGTLSSRVPFSAVPDDITFLGSTLNNEVATTADDTNPNKVGWRYFRVGVADAAGIAAQLGALGWELAIAGAPAGTEIALRRNFLPGKWQSRGAFNGGPSNSGYYQDFNSATGLLSRPGHQADIWYVGVYSGATALGNFSLARTALTPTPVTFASGTSVVTNQAAGTWRYFKFEVPKDANLLGWDLRVQGITGAAVSEVTARVLRDTLPGDAGIYDFALRSYWTRPNAAGGVTDPNLYLIQANAGRGPTPAELSGSSPANYGWLYGGTYYLGVKVTGTTVASYTVASRGIGTETTSYPIKVAGDLALTNGTASITGLAPREMALYRLTVPAGTPSWGLKLAVSGTSEASLILGSDGRMPSFSAPTNTPGGNYAAWFPVWHGASKPGNELIFAAQRSPTDTTTIAGVHYVAVISEGNSPASVNAVGTGTISATLTSVSPLPAQDLGTAVATETVQAVSLEAEEVKLYRFTVAPGTLSVEVRLTERTGNPWFSVTAGDLPSRLYNMGNQGDRYVLYWFGRDAGSLGYDSLVTMASPDPGTYTVAVHATNTNVAATANLRVVAVAPTPVTFTSGTSVVTNQEAGTWRYFKFEVPADANLIGWDLRLQGITGGTVTQAKVLRDTLPGDDGIYDFALRSYWTRPNAAGGVTDPNLYLIQANAGRGPTPAELSGSSPPKYGWLYGGTYYLGVKVTGTTAASYTVASRGIGTETTGYPIKVAGDLALTNGTASITGLAPREMALYRLTVPAGTQSWGLKLAVSGTSEAALMLGSDGRMPSFSAPTTLPGGNNPAWLPVWHGASKPGNELIFAAQQSPTDTTTIAGVHYVAVISEGNSPASVNAVGTGTISATLTSVSPLPAQDLGTAVATETVQAVSLEAEEVKLYRFTVAPGHP